MSQWRLFFCRLRSNLTAPSMATSLCIAAFLLCTIFIAFAYYHSTSTPFDRCVFLTHQNCLQILRCIHRPNLPAAAALPRNGSLFCWAMTAERYHDTRGRAVNETWISRCDHGVFFTNAPFHDPKVPYRTVFADTYENLFYKSLYAFRYIYEEIGNGFDWYLKADDDTFVIVENLNKYLATLDPSQPYYLGFWTKPFIPNGYNTGGAGYVLSKAALRQLADVAYFNPDLCPDDTSEDRGIGRCLAALGIFPSRTINERGQQRFNSFHWLEAFTGFDKLAEWMWELPEHKGYDMVARDLISFHHLSPNEIRLFEILLYRVDGR